MNVLKADHIEKYLDKRKVLDDISLNMEGGRVYGFVGRNGSGKTMLFRALAGLIGLQGGQVSYNGAEFGKGSFVLPSLGLIIENTGLYSEFTGYQNLQMLAKIKNIIGQDEIVKAIERVGLNPKDKRTVRKYSLGMKQRLAIAQAIMEKPEILMLDEPTNGLDEDGVNMLRNIIIEEKKRGSIVLLASHSREDMELLSDVIYQLSEGKIVKTIENNKNDAL